MNKLKCSVLLVFIFLGYLSTIAQDKYKLASTSVRFFSSTPVEDIEAENKASLGVLDTKTGNFSVRVPITEFKFKSTLMEDHFNENYMESEKYPNATFKGVIKDALNLGKDGVYKVTAEGDFETHGVVQKRQIPITITVAKGVITYASEFKVKLEDHQIKIPTVVFAKIAEVIDVKLSGELQKI
jgi:hypothetical protein